MCCKQTRSPGSSWRSKMSGWRLFLEVGIRKDLAIIIDKTDSVSVDTMLPVASLTAAAAPDPLTASTTSNASLWTSKTTCCSTLNENATCKSGQIKKSVVQQNSAPRFILEVRKFKFLKVFLSVLNKDPSFLKSSTHKVAMTRTQKSRCEFCDIFGQ